MELPHIDNDTTTPEAMKYIIESVFDGFRVDSIEILGSGYDSVAYFVNDKYIFKVKVSTNKKKGYEKEKAVCDFINKKLAINIKIPRIDFSYITDALSVIGYQKINGEPLNPEIYAAMSDKDKTALKMDVARFLRALHDLDYSEISNYAISNKQNVLEEYQLLKETIYDSLDDNEKRYVEDFMKRLETTTIFDGKKCLCHNDFSCNHLLIDDNKLVGVIDFGNAGIIDEYCDFIYLLKDNKEEIGTSFGEDVLRLYGDINIDIAKEYRDVVEQYYPIETIVYGLKNNRNDFVKRGREEMRIRCQD